MLFLVIVLNLNFYQVLLKMRTNGGTHLFWSPDSKVVGSVVVAVLYMMGDYWCVDPHALPAYLCVVL